MDEPCPLPVPGAVAGKERGPCGCRGLAGSAVPCPPLPLPPRSSRHRGSLWGGENHPMSLKTKAQSSSGLFCWEPGTAWAQAPVDARGGWSHGAEGGGALPSACPLPVLAHLSWHCARLRGAGQRDARLYPQAGSSPTEPGKVLGFFFGCWAFGADIAQAGSPGDAGCSPNGAQRRRRAPLTIERSNLSICQKNPRTMSPSTPILRGSSTPITPLPNKRPALGLGG